MKIILILLIFIFSNISIAEIGIENTGLTGKMLVDKAVPNILPIGDSITSGQSWSDYFGYRRKLQDRLGIYNYRFVGGKKGFGEPLTDTVYSRKHSGVSGDSSAQIYTRLLTDLTSYFPSTITTGSTVLILSGTNDIRILGYGTAEATVVNTIADDPLTTASMVGKIRDYNSNIRVYVGLIPPSTQSAGDVAAMQSFNNALKARLDAVMPSFTNLHYVDFFTAFTDNASYATEYLQDTLHPTLVGYNLMGDLWYLCMTSSSNHYCDGN